MIPCHGKVESRPRAEGIRGPPTHEGSSWPHISNYFSILFLCFTCTWVVTLTCIDQMSVPRLCLLPRKNFIVISCCDLWANYPNLFIMSWFTFVYLHVVDIVDTELAALLNVVRWQIRWKQRHTANLVDMWFSPTAVVTPAVKTSSHRKSPGCVPRSVSSIRTLFWFPAPRRFMGTSPAASALGILLLANSVRRNDDPQNHQRSNLILSFLSTVRAGSTTWVHRPSE